MVSVIIAETMMQLNQALRKNTFQSGLYLMVGLTSNLYKRLIPDFNKRSKPRYGPYYMVIISYGINI